MCVLVSQDPQQRLARAVAHQVVRPRQHRLSATRRSCSATHAAGQSCRTSTCWMVPPHYQAHFGLWLILHVALTSVLGTCNGLDACAAPSGHAYEGVRSLQCSSCACQRGCIIETSQWGYNDM